MKRTLLTTCLILCISPVALAQAENIGTWRWLGLGWGPGYHSGASRHHGHLHHHNAPTAMPAWEQAWPVAPEAAPPAIQPVPDPAAWRREMSPAQRAALLRESELRGAMPAPNSSAPSVHGYLQFSR